MAPARIVSSSSDEDHVTKKKEKRVATNGKKDAEGTNDDENGEEAPQPIDPKDVGMTLGFKNLYSGKEDRHGRFQWESERPDDLGQPAEDAETAKWALVVRNKRVYDHPRKVLCVHSIVVQSPLLKRLLKRVLKGYPGVTTNLQRLEFSGKFEPIIHRWAQFERAVAQLSDATENGRTLIEHAKLLREVLYKEFKTLLEESRDMIQNGVTTFEYLWTIFQPGQMIYAKQDGQDVAVKLVNTCYGVDRRRVPCFWVAGKYIDWNGTMFGTSKLNIAIYPFSGTRKIHQLSAFPFEYHTDKEALQKRLVERGRKIEAYAGSHYKAYHGVAWNYDSMGNKDVHNVKDRIVIDTYGWNKFQPNRTINVVALSTKVDKSDNNGADGESDEEDFDYENEDDFEDDEYEEADLCGTTMPPDGVFADECAAADIPPLTEEQHMICTPLLRGYALKSKQWLNFFVNSVREIDFNERAFESLVLPANQKELVLGFTESQRMSQGQFDDVIEGKGKGIILLLCGPPGVGKTLTAESVAEEMRVPLYMMSAGDLGLEPRNIESKLNIILEMCTRWNAILLLDEADVFLEERSLHELERNKLVTIFLRILEYYEGIMFLTTNRVKTFDAAFQSRIHISLEYTELTIESRRTVWSNFLSNLKLQGQDNDITSKQLHQLSLMNLNGRQIKNIIKTAQLLARRREQTLSHGHIVNVLDVTQHLHNETRESERNRASIFM